MVALIALVTFALLARALRSVLLPLKAVLLNVLSVGAAFGVVVLVWQEGLGSELIGGVPATGATTTWVPLAIFAFLYGLSMDYEVFILSRMREEYDAAHPLPRVRRARRWAEHRDQDPRHRSGRGDPVGRDRRPGAGRPGAGDAVRPLELVAARKG
jgi:uncharacterized membrane protein YdfJ with MMPL/SSD domain